LRRAAKRIKKRAVVAYPDAALCAGLWAHMHCQTPNPELQTPSCIFLAHGSFWNRNGARGDTAAAGAPTQWLTVNNNIVTYIAHTTSDKDSENHTSCRWAWVHTGRFQRPAVRSLSQPITRALKRPPSLVECARLAQVLVMPVRGRVRSPPPPQPVPARPAHAAGRRPNASWK
jgi:hypothetical protein